MIKEECCSNKYVIKAAVDKIKDTYMYLLVEVYEGKLNISCALWNKEIAEDTE